MHGIENGNRTAIKTFPLFVICKDEGGLGALQYYCGHDWPNWTLELPRARFYALEPYARGVITAHQWWKGKIFLAHIFVEGELYDKREETT